MDSDIQNQDFPESIIHLDQKLKALRLEIKGQLSNTASDAVDPLYLQRLTTLDAEVSDAISGLNTLIELLNTQSEEFKRSFYQGNALHVLNETAIKYLKQMEDMTMNFNQNNPP